MNVALPMRMLVIGTVWPEPASSAAGVRMLQLIRSFISAGWHITFASAAVQSEHTFDLAAMGVECAAIELNHVSFDSFVRTLNPDAVLFDRFMTEEQFGWRVAEQYPDAMRILDTEDLHCLRLARQRAFKQQRGFVIEDLLDEEVARREIAAILRSDLSLIISSFEMALLHSVFNIDDALLHYIPFMQQLPERVSWTGFEAREHFISIGNFLHEPNRDSVHFLKQEIWPQIRSALPEAELHVYGAYSSQAITTLHSPKEGFLIKGRAVSVDEVMGKARVCLAPLRFGAGLKGKLVDAMMNGTPSVTTPVGAEGMHAQLLWAGKIVNTVDEFAKAAVRLYTDRQAWLLAQHQGYEILRKCYPMEAGALMCERILELKARLSWHRKRNFTGSMLMHHTTNSAKYMSKWIEGKNSKQ